MKFYFITFYKDTCSVGATGPALCREKVLENNTGVDGGGKWWAAGLHEGSSCQNQLPEQARDSLQAHGCGVVQSGCHCHALLSNRAELGRRVTVP